MRISIPYSLPAAGAAHLLIRIRKEGLDAIALAALLQTIWSRVEDALNSGALVTVTEQSICVRRLPIVRP
jgi:hypothetical protein